MFGLLRKIESNYNDARQIGAAFVTRHLRPFANEHHFRFAGRPITIRAKSTDAETVRYLLVHGEYELEADGTARVRAAYDRIIAEGKTPVIVDAGGNIGMTAVWLSNRYPRAKIITIEPEAGNFRVLNQNVQAWPNIIPLCAAAGGQPGSATVTGEQEWAFQTTRSEAGDTPIVTIHQARALAGEDTELLIVKIDIEGFEAELFEGDCSWLDEATCVMIEPHDWLRPQERTSRSFQREMGKRDFNLHIRMNNLIYVRCQE